MSEEQMTIELSRSAPARGAHEAGIAMVKLAETGRSTVCGPLGGPLRRPPRKALAHRPVALWTPYDGWAAPFAGQLVSLPADRYDWIYLRVEGAASELEEEVWVHYRSAVDRDWLRTTGPGIARVAVCRPEPLTGLRLPALPDLSVTAVTLLAPCLPDPRPGDIPVGKDVFAWTD